MLVSKLWLRRGEPVAGLHADDAEDAAPLPGCARSLPLIAGEVTKLHELVESHSVRDTELSNMTAWEGRPTRMP